MSSTPQPHVASPTPRRPCGVTTMIKPTREGAVSSGRPGLASNWVIQATSGSLVRKMRMKIPLTRRIVGGLHELRECEKSFASCTAARSLDGE